MSNKYETGTYSITTFNERGAKLAKIPLGHVGLVQAQALGHEQVRAGEITSFVIERVLFNSMDHSERWLPKGTGRFSDWKPYRQED